MGMHCQVFVDGSPWMNAGVIMMRSSCAAARFLDYWLTLTRVNQMAADQGSFDLVVLHAYLDLNITTSVRQVVRRPCVRLKPAEFMPCVRSWRTRAKRKPRGGVCGVKNLQVGWTRWSRNTTMLHFWRTGSQMHRTRRASFPERRVRMDRDA